MYMINLMIIYDVVNILSMKTYKSSVYEQVADRTTRRQQLSNKLFHWVMTLITFADEN